MSRRRAVGFAVRHRAMVAAAVAISLCGLGGCKPRELGWEFQLDPSIDGTTRALQAHLFPGSCIDGPTPDRPRESVTYRFARGEAPPVTIRSLPPGTWAFEVEALDASCQPIGRGCRTLALPTEDASVRIPVRWIRSEPSVCDGSCGDGVCVGGGQGQDSGSGLDAAAAEDAGVTGDAGASSDAGRDGDAAPGDGGAEDAGPADAAL